MEPLVRANEIGKQRTVEQLVESLLYPNNRSMPSIKFFKWLPPTAKLFEATKSKKIKVN